MGLRGFLHVAFLILAASASASSAASGIFYECDLDVKISTGWISPKMGLIFDSSGSVVVIDGHILQVIGKPHPARVRTRNDKARITWTIPARRNSRGQNLPIFSYIAKLDLKTLAIYVVAKPVGYPQRWSGKGTCKSRDELPKSLR